MKNNMSNYHSYSDWASHGIRAVKEERLEWRKEKAGWSAMQCVLAATALIAAIAFSGFQPML